MNFLIKLLISLPALFFLPGYVGAIYWLRREKKINHMSFSHFIFISIIGSLILSSWIGLVLAELGFFSLNRLVIILWFICLIGAVLNKFKLKPAGVQHPKLSPPFFILLAILIFAGYLYFQPHELLLGGRDPGVYINTGISIAKNGSISIQNKPLAVLSQQDKIEFARHFNNNLMMGFYLKEQQKALVTPQFFHLFSLWYAIFYSLLGLRFFLYMPAFFAILSLWAIYLFTQKAFNSEIVALITSGLLSINIIQIWFARYADSEIMGQFLLFSGLYLFSLFIENLDKLAGFLGGLCFGLVFLLKVDLLFTILPFILLLGYLFLLGRFKSTYFYLCIPMLSLFIHSLIHSLVFCRLYVRDAFKYIFRQHMSLLKLISVGLIAFILLLLFWRNFRSWLASLLAKKELLRKVAFVLAVCLIFYGYYVRPDLLSAPTDINTHSFRWMGWFLHPIGLLLAIGGFLLVLYRGRNASCFVWIFLIFLYSIQYFYKIKAFPDYFWLMRRFIPLIYAAAIIFISYFVVSLSRVLSFKYRKLGLLPYLIIILLAISYIHADLTILKVREFNGATEFIQQISNQVKGNNLLICQGPSADLIHLISLPLWSISSQDVVELRNPNFNPFEIARLFSTWMSYYDCIYLLTSQKIKLTEEKHHWGLIDEYRFRAPFMEFTYNRPPKNLKYVNIHLKLQRLLTTKELNPNINFIDIGGEKDWLIKSGFYHKEGTTKESFRWSKAEAVLYLPALSSRSKKLLIRMSGGRPEEGETAQIQIYINDKKLKELELKNYFKEYSISLPIVLVNEADRIFPSKLKIKSNVFIPAVEMGTADTRELGIMLDFVAIK